MSSENENIINTIISQYMANAHKQKAHYEDMLPKVKLKRHNMEHCQLLLDRDELLSLLPKNGVVAEIGVDKGDFSEKILNICSPEKLFLVDAWHTERYHDGLFESVTARFSKELEENVIEIKRGLSVETASQFADRSLDWVYIDTDHSYETTIRELCAYAEKVKPGGIISGHDYTMGNFVKWYRYGVIEAVHQFCVAFDWELIFITADVTENQSFAIRKIQ
ncbi:MULTISPECIES: class I SAM-dependent methyltransferase [Enterobacter]|uniref:class I SAM-dependent methyltransferase n=1 Tax=Enterobacter TaxID=547 RepID=UPI001260456B|nr:class I SAM-dependent methyltransferase [Enterobacter oligotrophicus]ELW1648213.1 class I SAM-dependent methyltransferase [Enterobacter oligotrophicus]MBT9427234.1 class I SAM-dependent methyltransferase [Enterobacter oligotrophicus]